MTGESPELSRDPDFVVVGHVSKPHGTKGEVFVLPLTDRPEATFSPGGRLLLSTGGELPDPEAAPLGISTVRPYRRGFLVVFDEVRDRGAAELLRGKYLMIPFAQAEPLEDGELFYHQLLGMEVVTAEGIAVGRIREIYPLPPADLLDVTGPDGDRLIPFTRQVVVHWSVPERRLVIDPPPGLLDL